MKWIRTFPAKIPDNRSYVVDNIPVVYMDRNYLVVLENLIDDTVIVEWDIAFGQEDIETFEKHISEGPGKVHVAPYMLYASGSSLGVPGTAGKSEWAHRKLASVPASVLGSMITEPVEGSIRTSQFVSRKDTECDFFSFGMTYLPLKIVHQYLDTKPSFVNDSEFSEWYSSAIGIKVPIHWDVHPVHLHY